MSRTTQIELDSALDAVAAEVLQETGFTDPPCDMLALAAALRITVAIDEQLVGRARVVRFGRSRRVSIFVRPEPIPERLQWSVGHELGEQLAHRVFGLLGEDPLAAPPMARENIANQLAGRLLLPAAWFRSAGRECGWDLLALKQIFSTASHELIARRMLDCEPPVIISVIDQGKVTWRRTNFSQRAPRQSELERVTWLAAQQSGEVRHAADTEHAVQVWPVHKPDWKREIMRTTSTGEDWSE